MEAVVAMMAKPFIEGIVKDVIIPKIKSFSKNVSDGIKKDCILQRLGRFDKEGS